MLETFARIASVVLALAFLWAALAKVSAFSRWRGVLNRYGLPESIKPSIAVATPLVEIAIAMTILFVSVGGGAAAAVGALAVFSLAIVRARAVSGDKLPCGCFGGSNVRDYKTMMFRNLFLGVLAAVALLGRGDAHPVLASLPEPSDMLPLSLALIGVLTIVWIGRQTSVAFRRREQR